MSKKISHNRRICPWLYEIGGYIYKIELLVDICTFGLKIQIIIHIFAISDILLRYTIISPKF